MKLADIFFYPIYLLKYHMINPKLTGKQNILFLLTWLHGMLQGQTKTTAPEQQRSYQSLYGAYHAKW